MPIYRVSDDDENRFAAQPETGMGFQVIRVGGARFVVLANLIVVRAESPEEFQQGLLSLAEAAAGEIEEVRLDSFRLGGTLETIESRLQSLPQYGQPPLFPKTALVVERKSAEPQAFVRYSARRRDPRVDPKTGSYKPGTYAVPWSEIPLVPSGFAAVGRYALPNPFAARRLYPIITSSTPQLIGAAAPNYGQAGGGVEVLFPQGATALYGQPHVIASF